MVILIQGWCYNAFSHVMIGVDRLNELEGMLFCELCLEKFQSARDDNVRHHEGTHISLLGKIFKLLVSICRWFILLIRIIKLLNKMRC